MTETFDIAWQIFLKAEEAVFLKEFEVSEKENNNKA